MRARPRPGRLHLRRRQGAGGIAGRHYAILSAPRLGRARCGRDPRSDAGSHARSVRGHRRRRPDRRDRLDQPARDCGRLGQGYWRSLGACDRVAGPAHRRYVRHAARSRARAACAGAYRAAARSLFLRYQDALADRQRGGCGRSGAAGGWRLALSNRGWFSASPAARMSAMPAMPAAPACWRWRARHGIRACATCSACH